jgi:DNA integrity scanning protein DisA with diadenylate cyclase activity
MQVKNNIINELVEKCDNRLSNLGYKDYIEENIGEALDVVKHGGNLYDLDNIIHLKDIMRMSVSYELYSYINSHYDDSVLELGEENREGFTA